MNRLLLGIGSNRDPEANIEKSLQELSKLVHILKLSSFEKTQPVGDINSPAYLNGVALVETELELDGLKTMLKRIEEKQERHKIQESHHVITIDLDILVWNGQVLDASFEQIPFLKQAANELESGYESFQTIKT